MHRIPVVLAAFAFLVPGIACGGTVAGEPQASAAANLKAPPWIFTKTPNTIASYAITAPASAFDALAFHLDSSGTKGTTITQMAFQVTGSLQPGDLVNFQLVYLPGGPKKPSVILGTNDGSTWAPGATTSTVAIDLGAPFLLPQNFKGDFVLRVDVVGTAQFFFSPQLETVSIVDAGVPQLLVGGTCDLPLPGDSFTVN